MIQDYAQAKKAGDEAVKKALKKGTSPYLPVLDLLEEIKLSPGKVNLGLQELPLSRVTGNKTQGRNNAFANNFMPLLEEKTEFAMKWSSLYDSYIEKGIQNPIECFEYLNQYYVQEGNKRVSVSKFGESYFIPANVIRILPPKSDEPEIRAYYEYLQFYDVTENFFIVFNEPGEYEHLASILGQDLVHPWPEDLRKDLKAAYFIFEKNYKSIIKDSDDRQTSKGFLVYLMFYPMKSLFDLSDDQIVKKMKIARQELLAGNDVDNIEFVDEAPETALKSSVLGGLFQNTRKYTASNPLDVAFVFDCNNDASRWLDSHEAGRLYVEEMTGDNVVTHSYYSKEKGGSILEALNDAISDDNEVIFTVSPHMMAETMKVAIENPKIKFLNCSIGQPHPSVRSYHGKLYEASFLMGILAANTLLQKSDGQGERRIGYVARNLTNTGIANINAFAIGVSVMDPDCRISLKWQMPDNECNYRDEFEKENIKIYADVEYSNVVGDINRPGVFEVEENTIKFLGAPYYNWGKYYVRIVELILSGAWNANEIIKSPIATNYWFGLSTGVVDIITAADLPYQTNKLLSYFKSAIVSGGLDPFSGEIHSQNGTVNENSSKLFEVADLQDAINDGQIATMDWLNENIDGKFPSTVQ